MLTLSGLSISDHRPLNPTHSPYDIVYILEPHNGMRVHVVLSILLYDSRLTTSDECESSRNCQEVMTFMVGVKMAGTVGAKCCA